MLKTTDPFNPEDNWFELEGCSAGKPTHNPLNGESRRTSWGEIGTIIAIFALSVIAMLSSTDDTNTKIGHKAHGVTAGTSTNRSPSTSDTSTNQPRQVNAVRRPSSNFERVGDADSNQTCDHANICDNMRYVNYGFSKEDLLAALHARGRA